ncbi:AAA domain-containing protein [Caldicellulosiruptor morganii]|uniref:AAA domain-containing protein n=1 Tax=Caldicellulosiruptor morganii TaxID=1387555 RepID=A0ABY7BML4_9FIRM|nr:AAA domain-containing protein [Caldicellulosiruptor morganii]WAM34088.1 AAA domain-containing protein [Caldicellulosiruptor morganii]
MGINNKVCKIFEYLLAVKNLNDIVIRNIEQYDEVIWQKDLPEYEGCFLNGSGKYKEAWLEVHKQELPPVPQLPKILSDWVTYCADPEKEPVVKEQIPKKDKADYENFEDDPERVKVFKEWKENVWIPWKNEALPKKRIKKLYTKLFAIHQRIQREGEDVELAWGHGILLWNVNGFKIKRPVLVTPLELQFDAKNGIFMLLPTSKGTYLETDMLNNIDLPYIKSLQQMEPEIQNAEINVWDKESIEPILKEIVHTINPGGIYSDEDFPLQNIKEVPVISYSPVIFLRKTSGRIWQKELITVIDKIRSDYPIPETIKRLAVDDLEECKKEDETNNNQDNWESIGENLLFPLPVNNEQKLIAKKLAKSPGVVVQGPPGTGKSHTIANLICHLLAHGKRVLVTSEKERALRVLRDKIPEEIRHLCVSVLGGDSASVKELESSIENITENIDSYDPQILKKEVERLRNELYETRKKKTRYQNLIKQAGELESKKVRIGNCEMTPLEIAKWLKENAKHNWMPDSIKIDQECPLSEAELRKFFELSGKLRTSDKESLEKKRPKVSELPDSHIFNENVLKIRTLEQQITEKFDYIKEWNVSQNVYDQVDAYKQKILSIINELKELNQPWMQFIMKDSISGGDSKKLWKVLIQESRDIIKQIKNLDMELIEHEIVFSEDIDPTVAKENLKVLREKLKGVRQMSWFFKNITGRKYMYLMDKNKISLDGHEIRNENDVGIVIKYIEKNEIKNKLILKWNNIMKDIGGPQLSDSIPRFSFYVEELINKIEKGLQWDDKVVKPLQEFLNALGIKETPAWTDIKWFEKLYNGIEVPELKKKLNDANEFFESLKILLIGGKESNNAHPSWINLLNACEAKDTELWDKEYWEVVRLEGLEEDYNVYLNLKDRLEEIAPKWVKMIIEQGGQGEPLIPPDDWKLAWQWRQCDTYLKELEEKTNIEKFEELLKEEEKNESHILRELVAKSTWLAQIERTTYGQKKSLHAFVQAVRKVGKGTGKYANMYRKEVMEEMQICKEAIPVWIMPIQKIIENIKLTNDLFDVIIVDESSQSNLFALCALLRAKKAVIVGDDNQISPESIGVNVGEVHQLIQHYLEGIVPHASRFELTTSLYDIANQILESKVVLKEHFRSVPEIIQFSNDFMYGGKIIPLRLPMSHEIFEPPVSAIFVEEGFVEEHTTNKLINRPEAKAIVKHIEKLCSDPKYNGKTMGVISLQGDAQAVLIEELLREAIGEKEMVERKLICGDAYFFQGDERDIIFLSMVIAPNVRFRALTKRSDYQRFNVAASRARDQMFLFHSVQLEDINNPECARYRLLQYCQNPNRVQQKIDEVKHLFESKFEEDVYRIICTRGYRVIPQVKVANLGKRIDLVVEGIRNRLAIECDGDKWHGIDKWEEDIERQRILERVGWTFWRVRGSEFYRDPEKAMASLWKKLDEMGIKPIE